MLTTCHHCDGLGEVKRNELWSPRGHESPDDWPVKRCPKCEGIGELCYGCSQPEPLCDCEGDA
jgi:hypothetical protein